MSILEIHPISSSLAHRTLPKNTCTKHQEETTLAVQVDQVLSILGWINPKLVQTKELEITYSHL